VGPALSRRHAVLCALGVLAAIAPARAQSRPSAVPAAPRGAVAAVTQPWTGDLDGMIERRLIRVLVTYNRTHYFMEKGTPRGATYEAFTTFERELNAKLKLGRRPVHVVFLPVTRNELLPALVEGRGDIAVAGLTVTPERERLVDFTASSMADVDEVVVTGPRSPALTRLEDLAGRDVFVRESSSYYLSLAAQRGVVVRQAPEALEDEDILEMVNAGLVPLTVVDDYLAEFWALTFPNLTVRKDLAVRTGGRIAPAIRKNSPLLKAELDDFVRRHALRTTFGNVVFRRYLKNRQYARSATADEDMQRFRSVVGAFQKYGERYALDWVLVAAQGYQESRLDPGARSPRGAIGVMQVLPATGRELAVGDIRQLDANVHAGVKFLRITIDRHFAREPMDDLNRGLFALAAYNAGPARIQALRREAAGRRLNPNVWFGQVEPVVAEKVGLEPVQYVSNIYKYYVAYRLALEETAERDRTKAGR